MLRFSRNGLEAVASRTTSVARVSVTESPFVDAFWLFDDDFFGLEVLG